MNAPSKLWSSLTPKQRTEAIRYGFRMSHSRARIARDLGVQHATVTLWCKAHGIDTPPVGPPANAAGVWLLKPPKERRQMLVDLLATGNFKSGAALCATLECSKDALRKYAKKEGIELPNGRGANLPAMVAARTGNVPARRAEAGVAPRDAPVSHAAAPKPVRPAPDVATRVHVLDHRPGQCRFPLWPDQGRTPIAEMFYCGAPREDPGTSYCADCRKLIRRGAFAVEDREAMLAHMHLMRRVRDRAKRS